MAYMPPVMFEIQELESGEVVAQPRKFTEKEKNERIVYLNKVEVAMTYFKVKYHRSSEIELCTLSKVDQKTHNQIVENIKDSNWLQKNGY